MAGKTPKLTIPDPKLWQARAILAEEAGRLPEREAREEERRERSVETRVLQLPPHCTKGATRQQDGTGTQLVSLPVL